jgi:hypothetical protein
MRTIMLINSRLVNGVYVFVLQLAHKSISVECYSGPTT